MVTMKRATEVNEIVLRTFYDMFISTDMIYLSSSAEYQVVYTSFLVSCILKVKAKF